MKISMLDNIKMNKESLFTEKKKKCFLRWNNLFMK